MMVEEHYRYHQITLMVAVGDNAGRGMLGRGGEAVVEDNGFFNLIKPKTSYTH